MKVTLTSITANAERHCEMAARDCYDSGDKAPEDGSPSKLIKGVTKKGHLTVIGHASATFRIEGVSRALTHQLVKHKNGVESQRSQRYVKEGGFDYITPKSIKLDLWNSNKYKKIMVELNDFYQQMITAGIPKEDARFILPNACETTINVTKSFDKWLVFLKNRMDKHAQWEIRALANEMYRQLNKEAPLIFNRDTIESYVVPVIDWDIVNSGTNDYNSKKVSIRDT